MRPGSALAGLAFLSACAAAPTPELATPAPLSPPEIEFAGLVTDVRTFAEHHEFTDAAGEVHAIEFGHYRQVGEHGCCWDLVVLGTDADGPFFATFPTQGGLPDDCYVENDVGIDRGSHVLDTRHSVAQVTGIRGHGSIRDGLSGWDSVLLRRERPDREPRPAVMAYDGV